MVVILLHYYINNVVIYKCISNITTILYKYISFPGCTPFRVTQYGVFVDLHMLHEVRKVF